MQFPIIERYVQVKSRVTPIGNSVRVMPGIMIRPGSIRIHLICLRESFQRKVYPSKCIGAWATENDMIEEHYYSTPFSYRIQKTLMNPVRFHGVGLHSGLKTSITLHPEEPNKGIVFQRTDLSHSKPIPANFDSVVATDMATTLGHLEDRTNSVGTVEHLIAALYAMGITNVLVEVNGPEVPILDGSSVEYVEAIYDCGVLVQPFSTPTLKIYRPIKMVKGQSICQLLPRDRLRATSSIEFPHPSIGLQTYALELTPKAFREKLCRARTFGFYQDLKKLNKLNLAKGASLENVLAFSDEGIMNPEGPRYVDECVRHKILDAIGDLGLFGCFIEGELVSYRGGHPIHLAMLQTLSLHRDSWEILPPDPVKKVLTSRREVSTQNKLLDINM